MTSPIGTVGPAPSTIVHQTGLTAATTISMEPSTSTPTPSTSAPQGITHFMSLADKLLQMERSATLTIADAINTIHGAQKMHAVTYESMYEELLDTHQRVYDRDVEKAALFDRNRILNRQVKDLKEVISSLNLQLREAQEQLRQKSVVATMVCERCAQMELTVTTSTTVAPISLPTHGIPTTYSGGVSLASHTLTGSHEQTEVVTSMPLPPHGVFPSPLPGRRYVGASTSALLMPATPFVSSSAPIQPHPNIYSSHFGTLPHAIAYTSSFAISFPSPRLFFRFYPAKPCFVLISFCRDLKESFQKIKEAIFIAQQKQKAAANKHRRALAFKENDWVLLKFPKARLRHTTGKNPTGHQKYYAKLAKRYYDPFQILKPINEMAYQLKLPKHWLIHNAFHVSLLKPYKGEPPKETITEDPPEVEGQEEVLQPESVLRYEDKVLRSACKGADAVFHMAAPDSSINNFNLHYSVTVEGTRNVVKACISNNVHKLIYTSSPSAVFDGVSAIVNGDESMPYPERHDIYSETKAQAEAIVLAANGKSGLITCALRPSSIFGPGDKLLVPSLVAAARSGKMKFILGDGKNMYDFTYVENVAHAHVCAEKALDVYNCHGGDAAAGKAYFITNKEPIQFWEFMSEILEGLGYERPKIHLPVKLLMPVACLVAWTFEHLPFLFGGKPPQFTPSRLRLVSSWRTFKCDRAAQLIRYHPVIPLEEGMRRTVNSFSHLRAQPKGVKSREFSASSKSHRLLVSNLFLWRNVRNSLIFGVAVSALLYYFLISSVTVISAVSKLLLVLTAFLFLLNFLPTSVFVSQWKFLASTCFEVPEDRMNLASKWLRNTWNDAWNTLEDAVHKRNFVSLGKVLLFGFVMKVLGRYSFATVMITGWVLLFFVFYVYDRYESEIDSFFESMKEFLFQKHAILMEKVSYFQQESKNKGH
ncbi:hypothetical protein L7F22_000004 [Adiantum nelumboides]|nr:hypothetical protein [Adiantum nelumboides]